MSHYGIPWPLFRRLIRYKRRLFFTVDAPSEPDIVVHEPLDRIRETLGKSHFVAGWQLSYHYQGEDLNMRRPEYDQTDSRPWKQTHVRGFKQENDSVWLSVHYEYEPTQYPDRHLHAENLEVDVAVRIVRRILDMSQLEYTIP